jgi:hypothetical protein
MREASGLTLKFTRLRKAAKPPVAGRVQRRVSPWPDNPLGARLGVCGHARTVPEAMVQAQLADAPAVEGARETEELLGVPFPRQGARSASHAARWFAHRFRMRLNSVFRLRANVGVEPIGTAGCTRVAEALGDSSQPLQFGSNDGLDRVARYAAVWAMSTTRSERACGAHGRR